MALPNRRPPMAMNSLHTYDTMRRPPRAAQRMGLYIHGTRARVSCSIVLRVTRVSWGLLRGTTRNRCSSARRTTAMFGRGHTLWRAACTRSTRRRSSCFASATLARGRMIRDGTYAHTSVQGIRAASRGRTAAAEKGDLVRGSCRLHPQSTLSSRVCRQYSS